MRRDLADVLARGIALEQLARVLGLAFSLLRSHEVSLLLLLILGLASFCESLSALGLLVLDGLLPPALALHVFLALLFLSNLLALHLLPGFAFVLIVVHMLRIVAMAGEDVVVADKSGLSSSLIMLVD